MINPLATQLLVLLRLEGVDLDNPLQYSDVREPILSERTLICVVIKHAFDDAAIRVAPLQINPVGGYRYVTDEELLRNMEKIINYYQKCVDEDPYGPVSVKMSHALPVLRGIQSDWLEIAA